MGDRQIAWRTLLTIEELPQPQSLAGKAAVLVALLALAYVVFAYLIIPFGWSRYAKRHPSFDDDPRITKTGDGHPGDAINIELVGTEDQIKQIMTAAKWFPADPLGIKSDLRIAEATVFKKQYDDAPVSSLYLFGRKEDLAYEQPVGDDPRKRHHVRFWRSERTEDGRPVWFGSAIFDDRVGISRTTGQITHHTGADIDTERDYLFHDLIATGELSDHFYINDFHKVRVGRNGGGDPWHTDGRLAVGVIAPTAAPK
jgi:hypothetical protein